MPAKITLTKLAPRDSNHLQAVAGLWTGACGPTLAVSPGFVGYSLRPTKGSRQAGMLAMIDDEPVGFVAASLLRGDESVSPQDAGWINAISVLPEEQKRGIGTALMDWAEGWLHEQGCRTAQLGANLRPLTPGLPVEVETRPFFAQRGYTSGRGDGRVWDVMGNLAMYKQPQSVRAIDGAVYPAKAGDETALMEFLRREFGGRWRYEFAQSLLDGDRLSDFMLLWTDRGVDGFCRLTFEDSMRTIERFYPYQLPRPWGQLGPIGISADRRGQGYGAAVLDAGLRRLHNNGINGCVIDWTTRTDFYGKFGFGIYREYVQLVKQLV